MRRAQGVILRLGLCTPKKSRSVARHSTQLTGGSKNRFGSVFLRRVRLYFQRHQKHLGAISKSFQETRNLIDGSPLATGKVLDVLTSLPPVGCSRIWCFRARGFEEFEFQFRRPVSRFCPETLGGRLWPINPLGHVVIITSKDFMLVTSPGARRRRAAYLRPSAMTDRCQKESA